MPGTSHESASPLFRPDDDLNTTTNATSEFTDRDIFEDGFEEADIDGVRDWKTRPTPAGTAKDTTQ